MALTHAADASKLLQHEIDRTVWQPFSCAFRSMDGHALNALYGEQVLRVTPQGIDTRNAFKEFNETRFDAVKSQRGQLDLHFWFDSRKTNSHTSYEVGFYRLTTTVPGSNAEYYFGQFHIVLRKERDGWKIVQDWDTSDFAAHPIDAELFSRGTPLQLDCT